VGKARSRGVHRRPRRHLPDRASVLAALLLTFGLAVPVRSTPAAEPDAATLIADGDGNYARRGAAERDGVADPAAVEAAIVSYRRALSLAPEDSAAIFRLQRALHFRASYTGADEALQRRLYDEGTALGQGAVDRMEKTAAKAGVEGLRRMPDAVEVYYWTAASWGQWGLLRGKLASARKGIAGRVRDLAERVNDIDPAAEEGGGFRLLGRLHDQAPRIPFITGWISWRKAIEFLRRSQGIGPGNHVTWFFLAEALLEHDPAARPEALELLRRCATTPPHPEFLIEDGHYARLAAERLKREGAAVR
jgi:tetratricopeptide (TPR) repeat protein